MTVTANVSQSSIGDLDGREWDIVLNRYIPVDIALCTTCKIDN
jgi:hypothetical protein